MPAPDPIPAGSLDDLADRLRLLKAWAGDPSYETIKERVHAAGGRTSRSTVANCFRPGRRRMNTELVLAVVRALHPDAGYVDRWRQALRSMAEEGAAAAQVQVYGGLPPDLAEFTGRGDELEQLRQARAAGGAVVISAIEGMAGVGKSGLAVHAGHVLHREDPFDRVLFVSLRGFHHDPSRPPADPAAVLDGFLRLLGMPAQRIPHGLTALTAAYRDRLAGLRALVVLDDAASEEQVGPLLPDAPGCLALVTSRRSLAGLRPASRLTVDVFRPGEAAAFLAYALPGVPMGSDPQAVARISRCCGYLPLALSLIAGHIRNTPGWTLTDHADRLDERHRDCRLDTGVELALGVSCQQLPAGEQRLLPLVALHPGQDFDAWAAAALAGTDLPTAERWLDRLCAEHLVMSGAPGRYGLHDLVRAYAAGQAEEKERPADRRAALTRLFDYYLATAAAAMDAVYPAEVHRRPRIAPSATPAPDVTGPDAALAWLDTERPTLLAVIAHATTHGWFDHTIRLAHTMLRYLQNGYRVEALTVYGHACHAAARRGNPVEHAEALRSLGIAHLNLGRLGLAADHLRQALDVFHRAGDAAGETHSLYNLGIVAERAGRYPAAVDYLRQALARYREADDRSGAASAMTSIGVILERTGQYREAVDLTREALELARHTGNRNGEAYALNVLGDAEASSGRAGPGRDCLHQSLDIHRQLGNRAGEASVLNSLGLLCAGLGEFDQAGEHHRQALAIAREIGDPELEAWALNGLGEAAYGAGRPAQAVTHHAAAYAIAAELGHHYQESRARAGIDRRPKSFGPHPAPVASR